MNINLTWSENTFYVAIGSFCYVMLMLVTLLGCYSDYYCLPTHFSLQGTYLCFISIKPLFFLGEDVFSSPPPDWSEEIAAVAVAVTVSKNYNNSTESLEYHQDAGK